MGAFQRGFTLLEIVIAVGILALLAAAGAWAFSSHPNALMSATDDVDAAIASARAIAAASGNGATIVVAPRTSGFTLRVYSGRPSTTGAVAPANVMPVSADASIREATLGAPPFALFIDSAGDASGQAAYPALASDGTPQFSVIAQEPPCPPGGFVLTIAVARPAVSKTVRLACRVSLSAAAPENPSPTPNVPLVTPTALLFHWPGDTQQEFVATEWGYTHWFASAQGFSCGSGVAAFPNVLPSPYSAPPSAQEASLAPSPPPGVPYSYPNSAGGSMNDAPAAFALQPQGAGLCNATVDDDFGQKAATSVAVMGWLTATYGSSSATHGSAPLAIPASALPAAGSSASVSLSKTYDSASISPQVAFTGGNSVACAADVAVGSFGGSTPNARSATPATATIEFTVVALPPSLLNCSGVIFNHYSDAGAPSDAASESGEGIPFTLSLSPPTGPLTTLGRIVFWLTSGSGGACSYAQLYLQNGNVDANAPNATDGFNHTDANGCVTNGTVNLWATEANYSGNFNALTGSCYSALSFSALAWVPSSSVDLSTATGSSGCTFQVESQDQNITNGHERTVAAAVNSCAGNAMIVAVASGCEFVMPLPYGEPPDCTPGGSGGEYVTVIISKNPDPMLGTISLVSSDQTTGTYVWTRTAIGTQTISYTELDETCHHTASSHGTFTFN